jgi:hypothetical protein
MARALFVCRSEAGWRRLQTVAPGLPVVVASDDPRVQNSARACSVVAGVYFLERTEPFYAVAMEVLRVIDVIDAWLMDGVLPEGLTRETVRWTRNVEGGLTAQRIQDALLLIRSYSGLIRESGATEIWIAAEPRDRWMDAVMVACAKSLGLPVHRILLRPAFHVWEALKAGLRPLAVAAYYMGSVFRLGGGHFRDAAPPAQLDGSVVFVLASSVPKHVENVASAMQALERRSVRAIALCWSASERLNGLTAPQQLRSVNLSSIQLERWVPARVVGRSVFLSSAFASRRLRTWRKTAGLVFEGVPLHGLLAPSVWHFLMADLPQRIRVEAAMSRVLGRTRPAAIKPWGPEFFEGRAALRSLPARSETLVFHYWLGASLEWPYSDAQGLVDLFLAKGKAEASVARANYRLSPAQIELVGHGRFDALIEFVRRTPVNESRGRLGLPLEGLRFVGFDPNGALRGFQSVREQVEMTEGVLAAARAHPRLVIVVKAHPAYPIDHLLPLIRESNLSNVVVIPTIASVQDFLTSIDLLVTKYSTLLLEAALVDRIAVSVLLDGETRFNVFNGISEVVRSSTELGALLRLCMDEVAYEGWSRTRLKAQRRALPLYYHQTDRPAADEAADCLIRQLNEMKVTARAKPRPE